MRIKFTVPNWAVKGAGLVGLSWHSGYESAQTNSPRRGRLTLAQPRDHKLDLNGYSRTVIVRRSREVFRNSGYKRESVATMGSYAIGEGIKPQSLATDPEMGIVYEEIWRKFSKQPEVTNRHNMLAIKYLISRALDVDGEIFLVKTKDRFGNPKIQILETHDISNHTDEKKRIWDGIQVDASGRPTFYHQVVKDKSKPMLTTTKAIPARAVLHVFDPESPSAVRGIPAGQAGLNALTDVNEILAFETHATKQAAEMGLVLKSNRDDALQDGDLGLNSEGASPDTDEEAIATALGGRVVRIDESETLETFNSSRPSPGLHDHLEELHRESSGGGLPYEVLRDPSSVGGASVRLITSKTDRIVRYRQGLIISRALDHLFVYVVGFAITHDGVAATEGWAKVRWITPRKVTVDAGRESREARMDLELGIVTVGEHLGERGLEFDDWLKTRTEQARKMMNAAGHDSDEAIPMWMIYKPTGISFDTTGGGGEDGAMGGQDMAQHFQNLKSRIDSYGVAVRAGTITPQTADEDSFRKDAGLPAMGDDALAAWKSDEGVRRPTTLKSQAGFEAEQETSNAKTGEDEDDEE